MSSFEFALWFIILLFMMKEIHEVRWLRRLWYRFFTDKPYASDIVENAFGDMKEEIINEVKTEVRNIVVATENRMVHNGKVIINQATENVIKRSDELVTQGVLGLMDKVQHDKETNEKFFGFIGDVGVTAYVNAIRYMIDHKSEFVQGPDGGPPQYIKLAAKHPMKPAESVLNEVASDYVEEFRASREAEKAARKTGAAAATGDGEWK